MDTAILVSLTASFENTIHVDLAPTVGPMPMTESGGLAWALLDPPEQSVGRDDRRSDVGKRIATAMGEGTAPAKGRGDLREHRRVRR